MNEAVEVPISEFVEREVRISESFGVEGEVRISRTREVRLSHRSLDSQTGAFSHDDDTGSPVCRSDAREDDRLCGVSMIER